MLQTLHDNLLANGYFGPLHRNFYLIIITYRKYCHIIVCAYLYGNVNSKNWYSSIPNIHPVLMFKNVLMLRILQSLWVETFICMLKFGEFLMKYEKIKRCTWPNTLVRKISSPTHLDCSYWFFHGFPQFLQGNSRIVYQMRPQSFPLRSFIIHYSLITI